MPGPPGVKGEPGNENISILFYIWGFFSVIIVTRIIWKGLLRSFCGAKAKFLSRRLCVFFCVIWVHAVNNPSAL